MRKGRSQRKARASLPPRTTRTRAELGTADPSPQIVIGVTGSRPDVSHEGPRRSDVEMHTRSEQVAEQVEGAIVERSTKPTLEMLAEPTLELVREAERLELVAEPALEPARIDVPTVETVEAVMAMTAEVDESIPPAGDLAVEEPIADRFFSEGEFVAARIADGEHEHDWADVVARQSRKSLPEVVERRARLAKYVRWAVGGAAVLCLAALGRTIVSPPTQASSAIGDLVSPSHVSAANRVEAPEPKAAAAAVVAPAKTVELAPAAVAEAPAPAASPVAAAPVAEPVAAAPVAEPVAAAVDAVAVPKVDVPKGDTPAPASDKTALAEKNDARRALERGKPADAIAAGERSVALDPTDGEAWLLLGAAYQDKGNMAEARRAYTACTKEGKRGPIGECRAMLR